MKTLRNRIRRAGWTLAFASAMFFPALAAVAADTEFTTDFDIDQCTFASNGRQNPYFSLIPGDQLTFEGEDDGESVEIEITVTNRTRTIHFQPPGGPPMTVQARVVIERESVDGELVEVSRNYFARCTQTNDVFYFGESVDIYEDGQVVSHDGAWQAGVNGSQPGIVIPARFLLGSRYYQELAPAGGALDRAEHVEMGITVDAADETFHDCVRAVETSPLEPGHESVKVYCPGVGLVADGDITLSEFQRN